MNESHKTLEAAALESLQIYEQLRAANAGTDEITFSVIEPIILFYWPSVAAYLSGKDATYSQAH